MYLTPFEKQNRHRLIEKNLVDFEDILNQNDTENGVISRADSNVLRELFSHLTIPNISPLGVIQLGRQALQDEECIPIWAMDSGENLNRTTTDALPIPAQVRRITNQLGNNWRHQISNTNHLAVKMPDAPATVFEPRFPLLNYEGLENGTMVVGRPVVVLNTDGTSGPHTLAHEIWHVNQAICAPVESYTTLGDLEDADLMNELESYAREEIVLHELLRQGRGSRMYRQDLDEINLITEVVDDVHEEGTLDLLKVRRGLAAAGLEITLRDPYTEQMRSLPFSLLVTYMLNMLSEKQDEIRR